MSLQSLRARRWLPLLLALLPLIPLWRAVFLGEAIGPFDQIRQMAPWNGPKPSQPWDVLQADGVLQFYPWRDMVFEAWGKGQLPLWNPYELGGTPLLANSQSAGFYPPHLLLGLLHIPTTIGITFLAWLHLTWAGIGLYFLTRRLGGTRLGSTLAGASFALSPFMLGWTALASVIETVSWIPWILACVVALFRENPYAVLDEEYVPEPTEAILLEDGKMRSTLMIQRMYANKATAFVMAVSIGCMLLAGHLQFAAYGLMATFVIAIGMLIISPNLVLTSFPGLTVKIQVYPRPTDPDKARVATEPTDPSPRTANYRWVPLHHLVIALLIGGLLAAPQILPVLSYSKFSHRQNVPTQEGYAGYVALSIKGFELASLAYPTALGDPRAPIDTGGGTTVSQYWPPLVKQGANFTESALSIGPLMLAGLFLVPWKRKELWPLAALGLISLLLALGTALNMPPYFLVPGWSATGSPGRIVALFLICAFALGGYGLGESAKSFGRKEWIKACAAIALGVVVAFVGPMLAPDPQKGVPPEALQQIQSAAMSSMIPLLAISLILSVAGLALLGVPALGRYRPAVVLFPALLCWVGYGANLIMTGKPLDPVPGVPTGERVAFINGSTDWDIVTARPAVAPPNTSSLSRIHELGGYDSLVHRDTDALLHDIDGEDPAPYVNGNMMFIKPKADPKKLAAAGVTQVWTREQGQPQALAGPGRCSLDHGTCKIEDETYDSVTATAQGSGNLTLRDRMMPGWEATVDGNPVPIPDGVWRTVSLGGPGTHHVVFTYRPPGLKTGSLLFLAGLALLLVWPTQRLLFRSTSRTIPTTDV